MKALEYHSDEERENLRKNLKDSSHVKSLFKKARKRMEQNYMALDMASSTYKDEKTQIVLTEFKLTINYIGLLFDTVEASLLNNIENTEMISNIVQNVQSPTKMNELKEIIRKQQEELENVKNNPSLKWLERFFNSSSGTSLE